MYDRILIPVDGSPTSESVIPYAVGLGKLIDAHITFVRVVKNKSEWAQAEDELSRLAKPIGADYRIAETIDTIPTTILLESRSVPHTLIAMAAPGRSDIATSVLGSVARKLVHMSGETILVFRGTEQPPPDVAFTVGEVLLPLDGSTLSESMRLEAISWARALDARLSIVQVLPEMPPNNSLLESYDVLDSSYVASHARKISHEFGIDASYEVLHGDPADQLVEYIDGRKDVLCVIATRGHAPLHSTLVGSVTSTLVRNAGIPLIIQAPKAMMGDLPSTH